jgi:hypothetical protein
MFQQLSRRAHLCMGLCAMSLLGQSSTVGKLKALVVPKAKTVQAPAQAPPVMPTTRPEWVDTIPQMPGRIYALGVADLGSSEGQSLARAGDRARLEVVSRLRATVKGQTTISTRTVQSKSSSDAKATGYGEQRVSDDVAVSAQAEDLPGLTVERTYLDPKGKTAYALAYLDLSQAQASISEKLETLKEIRKRTERESTRKSRWRLRKAQSDLDSLDGQTAMLTPAGLSPALRPAILAEKDLVDRRLAKLEAMNLPPLDMSKMTVTIQSNIDLPPNLADWLDLQITAAGLKRRGAGADFVLDLVFKGEKEPAFIYPETLFAGGIVYHIDAKATLKDSQGVVLGRVAPVKLDRDDTSAGLMEDFQRTFKRRWNSLIDQLRSELE